MAVLWKSMAVFISLVSITEGWEYWNNGQTHCGPCLCKEAERGEVGGEVKVDCTSRNLTAIPAEIPRNATAL